MSCYYAVIPLASGQSPGTQFSNIQRADKHSYNIMAMSLMLMTGICGYNDYIVR